MEGRLRPGPMHIRRWEDGEEEVWEAKVWRIPVGGG